MKIEATKIGTTLVMAVQGRIDALAAQSFQDQLLSRVDGGETSILLDLAAVDFIGSAGLRAVLVAAKHLGERQGRFAVCALQDNVRDVFQISGFTTIIDVHPDRRTALAKLA